MADLVITAANVAKGANATVVSGTAGATITAGQTLYLDPATTTYKLADANASTTTAALAGIALHGASSGQPIQLLTAGPITIGATVTSGFIYGLSGTAGGIAVYGGSGPASDLVAGWYPNIIGIATSASVITVQIQQNTTAAV